MTWTLRLYDDAGIEIGYVEKPDKQTYNVSITSTDPAYDSLGTSLRAKEWLTVWDAHHEPIEGWHVDGGPQETKYAPKEHLERVYDIINTFPGVASATLADE